MPLGWTLPAVDWWLSMPKPATVAVFHPVQSTTAYGPLELLVSGFLPGALIEHEMMALVAPFDDWATIP